MKRWTVYILRCADGTLYTGITNDLDRRLLEHNAGKRQSSAYTRARRPVRLVYREFMESRSEALKREASIKQLSRQEKFLLLKNAKNKKVKNESG